MSTQKTANYQLNQWVKSDRILMEEFNADNLKIDDAIAPSFPQVLFACGAAQRTHCPLAGPCATAATALRICGGGFWWVQAAATP